jgi:hypothetical protein
MGNQQTGFHVTQESSHFVSFNFNYDILLIIIINHKNMS